MVQPRQPAPQDLCRRNGPVREKAPGCLDVQGPAVSLLPDGEESSHAGKHCVDLVQPRRHCPGLLCGLGHHAGCCGEASARLDWDRALTYRDSKGRAASAGGSQLPTIRLSAGALVILSDAWFTSAGYDSPLLYFS